MTKDNINKTEIIKKVTPVIEQAVESSGLQLLEIDFVKEFNNMHLQIFIYNPAQTISHEDCKKVTENLGEQLDALIPVQFYLEVSSAGTEKKLKSPKEYEIFKNHRVKVKLKKPGNDNLRSFIGIIIDYDKETGLKIQQEETNLVAEIEENNISEIKLEPKYEF